MDGRQPAEVHPRRHGVLALRPGQHVIVLLAAVVDSLVPCALRIYVYDRVDKASRCETRRQRDGPIGRSRSGKSELGGRYAGLDDGKVLPGADPAGAKTVREVGAHLPIQSAVFAVSSKVGTAGSAGTRAAQIHLNVVWLDVPRVHVPSKELNFVGELVIQAERDKVGLEGGRQVQAIP